MKPLTSGLVALALAGSGLAGTQAAATATTTVPSGAPRAAVQQARDYAPPPIQWGTCQSQSMVAVGARCGLLTVPLDYANPTGTKIKIGVSEIEHKTPDPAYQGIMLVNPGGPGGSGLNLSRLGAYVPNHGGDPFDWIGFDPRGVGISEPHLTCDQNYFPTNRAYYVPFRAATDRAWRVKTKGYADACAAAGGALLNHTRTTDWVNDMDSIRKAFGQEKINFYGFSYGTYLGQVYATMFPNRVRKMVWDGVVNPKGVWYRGNLDQDLAFNKSINIFFSWVARNNRVYHLGRTGSQVSKLWYKMLNKSRQAPFAGQIGPDEWTDAFLGAGYYVYGWTDTASAFSAAVNKRDFAPVQALYADANGTDDNTYAVYLAVQCTDTPWPRNDRKVYKDNWRIYKKAPFETWSNMRYNQPCSFWAGRPAPRPVKVKDHRIPPILMINEQYDGATPYAGALTVRKIFRNARMIEGVHGTTHAGSLSGVSCTDNRISRYLLTGKLPHRLPGGRADVRCPAVPKPKAELTARMASGAGDRLPPDLRAVISGLP